MDISRLCPNCMTGTISGGVCTACGKKTADAAINRNPNALPLGWTLRGGRYILGKVIGAGGFGITYLAWDREGDRRVALKELFAPSYVSRDQSTHYVKVNPSGEADFLHLRKRFYEEAESQYRMGNHPEILRIYDYFEENGTAYFSMEYLVGDTLRGLLQKHGVQSWQSLQPTAWQVLNELSLLHGQGLIHRDISPDNIFLQESGEAKLIDFGSARSYQETREFTQYLNRSFAPYEQWDYNGNQGPWTDIYALCATLYYAMSGRLPAMACDRITKIRAFHQPDPLLPLSQLNPAVPAYVAAAVEQGLSLDIEQRQRSIQLLARDLFPGTPFVGKQEKGTVSERVRGVTLSCIRGMRMGREDRLPAGCITFLGRDPAGTIVYPDTAKSISRKHCVFYVDEKLNTFVRDESSFNETYLNGVRLVRGEWRQMFRGQILTMTTESYRIL